MRRVRQAFDEHVADHDTVSDGDAAVDLYGRDYMTAGAAEIQKRLAADLVVLQQQLGTPRMWAVAAKLATLYAKTFPGSDGVKAVAGETLLDAADAHG
ncbi:MAG: hypothetical protein ACR2G2_05375 [Pseudonocardia sp.]